MPEGDQHPPDLLSVEEGAPFGGDGGGAARAKAASKRAWVALKR